MNQEHEMRCHKSLNCPLSGAEPYLDLVGYPVRFADLDPARSENYGSSVSPKMTMECRSQALVNLPCAGVVCGPTVISIGVGSRRDDNGGDRCDVPLEPGCGGGAVLTLVTLVCCVERPFGCDIDGYDGGGLSAK